MDGATFASIIAERDRRIAELEAEVAELAAVVQVNVSRERMSAMANRRLSILDSIKMRARREALEAAADVFAVDPWRPVERSLRRMAQEVKP